MAKNRKAQDAAAKAKKQKIVLACFGVALIGIGALQGPKLMKLLNPPAAPTPVVSTALPAAPIAVAAPNGNSASGRRPQQEATLAGVRLESDALPAAATNQLRSFTLFAAKDPFVPQRSDELPIQAAAVPAPVVPVGPQPASGNATAGSGAPSPSAVTPNLPPTNATVTMNGAAYPLIVKAVFPKADPLFLLVSLKPKVARIGVAGGSFADGKTLALKLGKQMTLVNDATGARYSLKLVFTGTAPEQTESFTQAKK